MGEDIWKEETKERQSNMKTKYECEKCSKQYDEMMEDCPNCKSVFLDLQNEAWREIKEDFEAHVSAQRTILQLCSWMKKEKPKEFRVCFGTDGEKLLDKALAVVNQKGEET